MASVQKSIILKQSEVTEIEQELAVLGTLGLQVAPILSLLERSKLFHLKHQIARARREATRALAGNEISIETYLSIQTRLDAVLGRKETKQ